MANMEQNEHDLTSQLADPVLRSTSQCFETMLKSTVLPVESGAMQASTAQNVVALIQLTGEAQACIGLSFPHQTARAVVERLIDFECPIDEELVNDCIGELANVIGGGAKDKLEKIHLSLGLPQTRLTEIRRVDFPASAQPSYLKFQSELGPFLIAFSLTGECSASSKNSAENSPPKPHSQPRGERILLSENSGYQ